MAEERMSLSEPLHLPAIMERQFDMPRSVARMLIQQGKVEVDGEVLTDTDIPRGEGEVVITVTGKWFADEDGVIRAKIPGSTRVFSPKLYG